MPWAETGSDNHWQSFCGKQLTYFECLCVRGRNGTTRLATCARSWWWCARRWERRWTSPCSWLEQDRPQGLPRRRPKETSGRYDLGGVETGTCFRCQKPVLPLLPQMFLGTFPIQAHRWPCSNSASRRRPILPLLQPIYWNKKHMTLVFKWLAIWMLEEWLTKRKQGLTNWCNLVTKCYWQ